MVQKKLGFMVLRRGKRAREALANLRRQARLFRAHHRAGDNVRMEKVSQAAWSRLASLFEALRNEQDEGYLAATYMQVSTGYLISDIDLAAQLAMIKAKKLDRKHPNCGPLSLREALNKIAHHKTGASTYRVDGRSAHYLILGGEMRKKHWVAEILVTELIKRASEAEKGIK